MTRLFHVVYWICITLDLKLLVRLKYVSDKAVLIDVLADSTLAILPKTHSNGVNLVRSSTLVLYENAAHSQHMFHSLTSICNSRQASKSDRTENFMV